MGPWMGHGRSDWGGGGELSHLAIWKNMINNNAMTV